MVHPVVLEHMQPFTQVRVNRALVRAIGEPRRVAVCENGDDARRPFRSPAVDGSDAAVRHRASHDRAMRLARHVELGGVSGAAGYLQPAVNTADGLSDEGGGHGRAPAISTPRTMARCMSSILNSLCPRPSAPCAASAAAGRSAAGSRLAPARAASTRVTRHGLVPTPPR